MENISPLIFLFLLFLFIGSIGKSKKPNQNRARRPGQSPAPGVPQTPRQDPPRQPSAERAGKPAAPAQTAPAQQVSYTAHRGADGTLHPTERHQHAAAAPSLMTMEGEGIEGFDPCHDYMTDDPVLPVCEDLDRQGSPAEPGRGPLPLSFTKDSVVNAVVMSEILNRRTKRNRFGIR